MNTILVPTDFSEAAYNATDYAFEIAKQTNSKIILLHVYAIPVMASDIEVLFPIDQLEQSGLEALQNVERKMKIKHGTAVEVECKCLGGLASHQAYAVAVEYNIDLIVMGMRGSGFISEKIMGSVTTDLIRKSVCPVLAVHESTRFSAIKRIMLASDYEEPENKKVFEPLKELAKLFKSHIYVLKVSNELETVPSARQAAAGIKLDHAFEGFNHSFHEMVSDDVTGSIVEFAKAKQIDMIAMIPHKHSFINRILHEPHTRRVAFHANLPLLALH